MKALNFGLIWIQEKCGLKVNTDIELYQGSVLFSITFNFAQYLIENREKIRKRFRFLLAADELFIQSIIMDSPYREKLCYLPNGNTSNARLIDRTRPDGKNSPHTWRTSEFDYLVSQPKEICFARKFNENVDFVIVEKIAEYLMKRG